MAKAVAGLPADQQFAIAEQHYDLHGAEEGRAPNAWFDAVAYLNANPDLQPNGVTVATALAHYAAYGWDEGRTFNSDPALVPSNFTASAYAVANPDVATALGITDTSALTQEQTNQLLSHYLSHGITEGRAGAGAEFGALVGATGIEITGLVANGATAPYTWTGSVGNDLFLLNIASYSDPANLNGLKINGVQGTDTLKITGANAVMAPTLLSIENVSVALAADAGLTANGVQNLTVAGGHDFAYTGSLLQTLSIDSGNFTGAFNNVDGAQNVLNATVTGAAGGLVVNGVETLNVTLGEDAGTFGIASNGIQGTTLAINLDGGKADVAQIVDLKSSGSGDLASVVVNAADLASDLKINDIGDLQNVKSISVTTGAGDDTLDLTSVAAGATVTVNSGAGVDTITVDVSGATGAKVTIDAGADNDTITVTAAVDSTVTVNGGAGNDTINGSVGTDTLTGGAGADAFVFGSGDALVHTTTVDSVTSLSGWDIVTDFKNVTVDATVETVTVTDLSAVATGPLAGVGAVTNGIITSFETGFLATHTTLQSIVEALNDVVGTEHDGLAFSFGGNAYVWMQGADDSVFTDDSLVQLTGVNAQQLEITGSNITFHTVV